MGRDIELKIDVIVVTLGVVQIKAAGACEVVDWAVVAHGVDSVNSWRRERR